MIQTKVATPDDLPTQIMTCPQKCFRQSLVTVSNHSCTYAIVILSDAVPNKFQLWLLR
jgi:hypothetical protein